MATTPPQSQHTDPVATKSPDIVTEIHAGLEELVPEAFSNGKIDFDKVRAALGSIVDDQPARYSFSWAGKRDTNVVTTVAELL